MRRNYWTCSKFADWIRGTEKGGSKTGLEWRQWKKASKEKHPVRYWIAEEGLDQLQDFIFWPIDKLYAIKYWIVNRYVSKTHALTSNLKKGQYHEFDTRMLHCLFDELVNFVEIEQAWSHILWNDEAHRMFKVPWYAKGWFRTRTWRDPEAGISYLTWASKLTSKEDYGLEPGDPNYNKPTPQAEIAIETLVLYHWWKDIRPARPDPHDESGWTELCNRRRSNVDADMWWIEDQTDDEKLETRSSLDICNKLEEQYDKEDEDMMIRLIKIRRGLWT